MATPIRIWTHATCHPAFRSGGWAFVRAIGDQVYGQAGGERAATTARMELAGVLAALRDLPSASGAVTRNGSASARPSTRRA